MEGYSLTTKQAEQVTISYVQGLYVSQDIQFLLLLGTTFNPTHSNLSSNLEDIEDTRNTALSIPTPLPGIFYAWDSHPDTQRERENPCKNTQDVS